MRLFTRKVWLTLFTILACNFGHATTITLVIQDGPDEGFNDSSPVTPVTGNNGTTLGEQRRNVFQAAADYWEQRLDSEVEIIIDARFDTQFCSGGSAVLGSAGPRGVGVNFNGAPRVNTAYPVALANSIAGIDISPGNPDIGTTFNSAIDEGCLGENNKWDYRIGVSTGSSLQLYSTVLHEIAHGLGFLTFVNGQTGQKPIFGGEEVDDPYMLLLESATTDKAWVDMTNEERAESAVSNALVWSGSQAVAQSSFLRAGRISGQPRMYAPSSFRAGSSVSHWDVSLAQNELMEPSSTAFNEDWLTTKAFYDMGWEGQPCNTTEAPRSTWVLFSLDCTPPSAQNTVSAVFGDDFSGDYASDWAVFDFVESTQAYRRLGEGDVLLAGNGYWVIQITDNMATIDLPARSSRQPSPFIPDQGCKRNSTCFATALSAVEGGPESLRYNLVGNPFRREIALSDLRIVTNSGTCTDGCSVEVAFANDVIADTPFVFSDGSYKRLSGDAKIPSQAGMWVYALPGSLNLEPRLLFPR